MATTAVTTKRARAVTGDGRTQLTRGCLPRNAAPEPGFARVGAVSDHPDGGTVTDAMTSSDASRSPESPASPTATVVAQELTKSFGSNEILHALDLEVAAGTIVGIIGPSGCGKTTLIRILTGVYRSSTGAVLVFGKPPEDFSPADRTRFGYMPQIPVLFPTLTLWNNLRFMAQMYGVRRRGRRARLRELL